MLLIESLLVKVLVKQISLICFRAYLEVYVAKNPTCFSRWSVRMDNVRQLNVFSFSKKDNSPRGYQTVGIEELQLGDKIIIGNYFTTIVEGEN